MTRHKMHCPQKYATVFSFFPICSPSRHTRSTHIRRVCRVLPVPIVITPAAQLETTAAHSVKRSKQFSSIILISTRLDFYLYFPIRFDFDFKFDFCFFFLFSFSFLFNLLASHAGTCPFSFAFFTHYFNKLYSILSLWAVVIQMTRRAVLAGGQLLMFYC